MSPQTWSAGSCPHLLDLVQPLLVGLQLGHEGLVLQPLAVEVPGLVVGHVLGRQHLLTDPQGQLQGQQRPSGSGTRV